MGRHRECLSFQTVREDIALGALEQAADRGSEIEHRRRHLPVQPFLVEHRRQQPDRGDDEGLILRRPDRHRDAVDVRAPGTAGNDIAMFAQMAAIAFEP